MMKLSRSLIKKQLNLSKLYESYSNFEKNELLMNELYAWTGTELKP